MVCRRDIRHRRHRHRHHAVLAADVAAPLGERGKHDFLRAQIVHADCRTDDVHDGIDGPHFVEMHLLHGNPVRAFELPSVIVADAGLGTINAVVLTVEYMRAKHLPVRGIIFNHFHPGNVMEEDNLAMCEAMTGIPVIACVKDGDDSLAIDETVLENLFEVKEL